MAEFYSARSETSPPLPWTNFAPPFSPHQRRRYLSQRSCHHTARRRHPSRAERRVGRLKEIHDAGIHRSAERWCPHHAARRGSLNGPALPAGSRVERDALTPRAGTRSSEVIVTYNFGSIYDYMNESAEFLAATAPLELSSEQLRSLLRERERQAGRYFAGRLLGRLMKDNVGSRFASRFFLRSEAAGRDMWFVHYSKVPRSQLVMSEAHWAVKNASITQGEAGLDMLGFRPDWEDQIALDFGFDDTDIGRLNAGLMADLPRWLEQFDVASSPTIDVLLSLCADGAAATETHFIEALKGLEVEGEIEVLTPRGSIKRPSASLRYHHRIMLRRQSRFLF